MNTHCCSYSEMPGSDADRVTGNKTYPGSLSAMLRRVMTDWVMRRKRKKADRDATRYLATLDDSALKDIGLTRHDVRWAGSLSSSVSATEELQRRALGRCR